MHLTWKKFKITSSGIKRSQTNLRQSYWDYLTTKTSKTNGFDTIEIDLVDFYNWVHNWSKHFDMYALRIEKGKLRKNINHTINIKLLFPKIDISMTTFQHRIYDLFKHLWIQKVELISSEKLKIVNMCLIIKKNILVLISILRVADADARNIQISGGANGGPRSRVCAR